MINISYELDIEDFLNFNLFHTNKQYSKKIFKFLHYFSWILVIIFIIVIIAILLFWDFQEIPYLVICFIFFMFFKKQINYFFMKYSVNKFVKQNKEIFWLKEIMVSDSFIEVKGQKKESKNSWEVLTLEENNKYMFLYTTTISAFIIPKEKIMPQEKKEEVISFIRSKFKK